MIPPTYQAAPAYFPDSAEDRPVVFEQRLLFVDPGGGKRQDHAMLAGRQVRGDSEGREAMVVQ